MDAVAASAAVKVLLLELAYFADYVMFIFLGTNSLLRPSTAISPAPIKNLVCSQPYNKEQAKLKRGSGLQKTSGNIGITVITDGLGGSEVMVGNCHIINIQAGRLI